MGNSNSMNVLNDTTNMITNQTINMVNNTQLSTLQTQGIIIKDNKGDVDISGNEFYQNATMDFSSVMNAVTTQESQQSLMQQLNQQAEAMNKDLNLFQFSNAQNIINNYVNTTINSFTNIIQNCAAAQTQGQLIEIESNYGNVTINNNTFTQLNSLFGQCIYGATASQTAIQDVQEQMDQKSSAKNYGIPAWALVLMALFALIFMCLPLFDIVWVAEEFVVFALKIAFMIIGVLLIFAGIIMAVLYFTMYQNTIRVYPNQSTIAQLPDQCKASATTDQPIKDYNNINDVGEYVIKNKLKGFDYYDLGDNVVYTLLYSNMTEQCQESVASSKLNNPYVKIKAPQILSDLPTSTLQVRSLCLIINESDNENNGCMFMLLPTSSTLGPDADTDDDPDDQELSWTPVIDSQNKKVQYVDSGYTIDDIEFVYSEPTDESFPENKKILIQIPLITKDVTEEWIVYTNTDNEITSERKRPPDYYSYTATDNYSVASGFNVREKRFGLFFLIIGIIIAILGIFATIFTIKKATQKKSPLKK